MRAMMLSLAAMLPSALAAHPHVFVDTGFEFVLDSAGALTHVRVTWAYDEYYSLLIVEDMGLDSDRDGVMTAEDIGRLTGFDANWDPGFNGDLVATIGDAPLDLSRPLEPSATVQDGRIVTTHLRAVAGAPSLAGLSVSFKPYDATYYTAYEVTLPVTMTGGDACMIEQIAPDIDGQLEDMRAQLLRLDANADLAENDLPEVGGEFATEVRVSCPAS